ncbi:MAG: hypothetical protein JO019_04785 [Candidatus Kaiserbacteria bacterium]|nr:hypothetical protein [Candidatus Kaiserbacteria bacterium]
MGKRLIARYRAAFSDLDFVGWTLISIAAFVASLVVNFWAIRQATERASNSVTDAILSNVPIFQVDDFFVYGTAFVILVSLFLVLTRPKRIPFALLSVALFIVIRSAFTLLTHLGPPEIEYPTDFGKTIASAFFGADQFFSAHTGMPFLGALGFWHKPLLRYFFLAASVYFATVVLLGHIHYSIDVASAFFITYGIYQIACVIFARHRRLFLEAECD